MRKRQAGNDLVRGLACAIGLALLIFPSVVRAREKGTLRQYALIAGTVFEESGMSARGVELQLIPDAQDAKKQKLKKLQGVSDARGEFTFRVPPVESHYTLMVRRDGFRSQEKRLTVNGDERIDLTLRLEPAR